MRKLLIALFFGLFLVSLASAAISLENEPRALYNFGDTIELTVNIVPSPEINDLVILYLSCSGEETEIYKEYLYLTSSTQKEVIVPLVKGFIGESQGECTIKSKVGDDKNVISSEFEISNWIDVSIDLDGAVVPGEVSVFSGSAVLENGEYVEGFVELKVGGDEIFSKSVVSSGEFEIDVPFADNFEAGNHKLEVYIYEKDSSGEITNSGNYVGSVSVLQVPTNLEVLLEEKEVVPGEELKGEVYLYDQTGKEMDAEVYVAIKDDLDQIVEKIEVNTGEGFSYIVEKNQLASVWSVSTYSEELLNKISFEILENKELSIVIANKTLIIENIGNVVYSEMVPVMIGEQEVNVSVDLGIGESEKYKLSAPSGEYEVQAQGVSSVVSLTGNSVKLEKLREGTGDFRIFAWAFIVLILGVASYFFFKRVSNKTFFGKRTGRKSKKKLDLKSLPEPSPLVESKVKAELSLSISGTKQNSPVGCIYIKNYEEVKEGQGGVNETLGEISTLVARRKGLLYENRGNIFYFIPPVKTKTFQNEIPMLELTEEIVSVLNSHNKKFKQKIQYGTSLNFGTIVTRQEHGTFKFMSMGTLMTTSKKLALKSTNFVLMSDKFRDRVNKEIKSERVEVEGMEAYKFLGYIKTNKDHSKFIKGFLERQKKL